MKASGKAAPSLRSRFYPEVGAGGFTSVDAGIQFYNRVNALLRPDMVVLDYGAGRGRWAEDQSEYRRKLRTLKGKVRKVVGVDVSEAVTSNPMLDEAHVIKPDQPLPFPDESFDLIVSDWVFEHVEQPEHVARELTRVLKPNGWLCARTLNRFGYSAIGATLIPNSLHVQFFKVMSSARRECDIFPTRYRLNTMGQIERYFPPARFDNFTYTYMREPQYVPSALYIRIMLFLFRLTPRRLAECLMIFLRKKSGAA